MSETIAPAQAATTSEPTSTGWRVVAEGFWTWLKAHPRVAAILIIAWLMVNLVIAIGVRNKAPTGAVLTWWCYGLTVSVALLIAVVVGYSIRAGGGKLSDLVVGQDRRTSTSKTQYLVWTVGVAFALLYIALRTFVTKMPFICEATSSNCVPDGSVWEQYVILLGVPATAAIVAKASTTYKVVNGIVQTTDARQAKVADIATDNQGNASITDVQYLIFNLVAFLYFAINFLASGTFVEVPSMILGLTSTAAATYALNKTLQTNRPVIKAVLPSTISPGRTVTVTGSNFFPDPSMNFATIKVGGQVATATRIGAGSSTDTVTFQAPQGVASGPNPLTITPSSGTESDAYPVTVVAPTILGWLGTPPAATGTGKLRVAGLAALPQGKTYEVRLDSQIQSAAYDQVAGTLVVSIPAGVSSRTSPDFAVLFDGAVLTSGAVKVA